MSVPAGYKTVEQVAVELDAPISRVQAAINSLNIPSQSFAPDRRRRYYTPEDVAKIKEWVSNR